MFSRICYMVLGPYSAQILGPRAQLEGHMPNTLTPRPNSQAIELNSWVLKSNYRTLVIVPETQGQTPRP